ncbi:hypothetical protein E2320_010792, partial [Naja naja]
MKPAHFKNYSMCSKQLQYSNVPYAKVSQIKFIPTHSIVRFKTTFAVENWAMVTIHAFEKKMRSVCGKPVSPTLPATSVTLPVPKTELQVHTLSKAKQDDIESRKKETDIFENLLEKFKETKISHVIIYEGLMGYGKSQLVTEIAYLGQAPGQKVVAMELTKINAWQNFFAVRTLMAMFLGVDVCKTYDARQYILLSKLRGVIEEQYLCLFNNLFHVKAAEKEVLIFAVDEAQFIDKASWDFLDNLLKNVSIFVVMALSPINHKGRILCSSATQILNSPSTTFIKLRELSPSIIIQKACQDLGVVSITRELETFLIQRSHGNPFYCEELLRNLHLNNVLQFHVLEEDEEKEDEWDSLFTTTVLKTHASKMLDEENELYICTVRQNVKLTTISLPPTLK